MAVECLPRAFTPRGHIAALLPEYAHRRFFCPILKTADLNGGSKASESRRRLFHECLSTLISKEFIDATENGARIIGPDGKSYRVFPWIAYYSCDLPEAFAICLTRGIQGSAPCPKCVMLSSAIASPRLADHREDCLNRANLDVSELARDPERAKLIGSWPENNGLGTVVKDVYSMIAPDALHQIDLGVTPELCTIIQAGLRHGRKNKKTVNVLWNKFLAYTSSSVPPF